MATRNPTYHRRRQERLRREESHRVLNVERERALMNLAKGITTALITGHAQAQADAARGDGAFAFPPAPRGAH